MGGLLRDTQNLMYCAVKRCDAYQHTINFTYKGENKFKTFFGGLVSLFLYAIVLIYTAFALANVFNREGANVTLNTAHIDLAIDDESIHIDNTNFQFAFKIGNFSLDEIQNNGVIDNLELTFTYFQIDGDKIEFFTNDIELRQCSSDHYRVDNSSILIGDQINIEEWICPYFENIYIKGNIYSDTEAFFQLRVEICRNNSNSSCDNLNFSENKYSLSGLFLNPYIDINDFEKPIKKSIDTLFEYTPRVGDYIENEIYMKNNVAELQDDYWSITGRQTTKEFIRIDRSQQEKFIFDDMVGYVITFHKDNESETYKRRVQTIFDTLGNIGGIYSLLLGLGGVFVSFFADRLFTYSIISNFYQVDTNLKDKSHKSRLNKLKLLERAFEDQKLKEVADEDDSQDPRNEGPIKYK